MNRAPRDRYAITGHQGQLPAGLTVSPYVRYLLTAPAPHLVWWLAADASDGAVVGGLRMSRHGGPTGRDVLGEAVAVEELSVDPAHQRTGVGTGLMRAAEEWVSRQPALPQTVGLGVEVDNAAAIGLYTGLGYEVAARGGAPITFAGSNGKPCQVMYKRLDSAPRHL